MVGINTLTVDMQPNDKERKHNTLHSFFRSSFKKKKLDTTVSHIDEFSQTTELNIPFMLALRKRISCLTKNNPVQKSLGRRPTTRQILATPL